MLDALSWYTLRTSPRKESMLKRMLENRGYDVLLPQEHKWKKPSRHSKRKVLHTYPAMPGYLFVATVGNLRWHTIRALPFILGYLGDKDGKPHKLTSNEIERLVALSSVVIPHSQTANPHRAIRPNDKALIVDGPLMGRVVEIREIVGQKAKFAMEMLGSLKLVEIEISRLEAA